MQSSKQEPHRKMWAKTCKTGNSNKDNNLIVMVILNKEDMKRPFEAAPLLHVGLRGGSEPSCGLAF